MVVLTRLIIVQARFDFCSMLRNVLKGLNIAKNMYIITIVNRIFILVFT